MEIKTINKKLIIIITSLISSLIITFNITLDIIASSYDIKMTIGIDELNLYPILYITTFVLIVKIIKAIKEQQNVLAYNLTLTAITYILFRLNIITSKLQAYYMEKIKIFNNLITIHKDWNEEEKLKVINKYIEKHPKVVEVFPESITCIKENIQHTTIQYIMCLLQEVEKIAQQVNIEEHEILHKALEETSNNLSAAQIETVVAFLIALITTYIYLKKKQT